MLIARTYYSYAAVTLKTGKAIYFKHLFILFIDGNEDHLHYLSKLYR